MVEETCLHEGDQQVPSCHFQDLDLRTTRPATELYRISCSQQDLKLDGHTFWWLHTNFPRDGRIYDSAVSCSFMCRRVPFQT